MAHSRRGPFLTRHKEYYRRTVPIICSLNDAVDPRRLQVPTTRAASEPFLATCYVAVFRDVGMKGDGYRISPPPSPFPASSPARRLSRPLWQYRRTPAQTHSMHHHTLGSDETGKLGWVESLQPW